MYLKCFHMLEILYQNDAELCWSTEKSGLNLTCTGSRSQLAAAHMKWAEYLRLLPSERGLLWRTLPQITPKLTVWEGSEWTQVLSHFSLSLLWTGNKSTGTHLDTQQHNLRKYPSFSHASLLLSPAQKLLLVEACTFEPRDRALPFAS